MGLGAGGTYATEDADALMDPGPVLGSSLHSSDVGSLRSGEPDVIFSLSEGTGGSFPRLLPAEAIHTPGTLDLATLGDGIVPDTRGDVYGEAGMLLLGLDGDDDDDLITADPSQHVSSMPDRYAPGGAVNVFLNPD